MSKSYIGDEGVALRLNTGIDISGASVKKIKYKKPDGTIGDWDAAIVDSQKLRVITDADTWDQDGNWIYHAYVEVGTKKGYGDAVAHMVYALFK